MRNIALKLMYNGTAYHGWQVQKNAVTVCETLQKALEKITGAPVHLTGCGRTDAGVHAERYIANFRTESRIPLERLPFAINTHTPEDIAVSEALEVAEDFNAIGSCLKKEYTYRIYNSRVKNPFYVNRAYFYPKRLDEEFLNRAAHQFVAPWISANWGISPLTASWRWPSSPTGTTTWTGGCSSPTPTPSTGTFWVHGGKSL